MLKQYLIKSLWVKKMIFCSFIIFLIESSGIAANLSDKTSLETFQSAKKRGWLTNYGEQVWIGRTPDRTSVQACRKDEHAILYLKSWGIAVVNSSAEIIYCPKFFSHFSRNYNPRK